VAPEHFVRPSLRPVPPGSHPSVVLVPYAFRLPGRTGGVYACRRRATGPGVGLQDNFTAIVQLAYGNVTVVGRERGNVLGGRRHVLVR